MLAGELASAAGDHRLFIRMLPHLPWKRLVAGGVQRAANAVTLKG